MSLLAQPITVVSKRRRIYVSTRVFGKTVRLQLDTGFDITVIGKNEWIRLGFPNLHSEERVEHTGGSELEIDHRMVSVRGSSL